MRFFLLICVTSCLISTKVLSIDGSGSIISNGVNRTFEYHAPGGSIATGLPVFIIMHGDGGTGLGIKGYSGFDAVADSKTFLAIYPDAINGNWNRAADQVAGDACTGSMNTSDDVLFISDLIDYLCTTYQIDRNKVYATGHSAGGYMSYNLAIQLTDKIAAFAPVSGDLCGDDPFIANKLATNSPVAIYHVHGSADAEVGYPDPDGNPVAWGEWPLNDFGNASCSSDTYSSTSTIVAGVLDHVFCSSMPSVHLIEIVGGSHDWPNVAGYDAADAIATFCLDYQLNFSSNCLASIDELSSDSKIELKVMPNPSKGVLTIKNNSKATYQLTILNLVGESFYSKVFSENEVVVDLQNLPKGIYVLKAKFDQKVIIEKIIIE